MTKKAQAIILGIVCLILTIGICVQIKTVNSNGTTTSNNKVVNNLKSQVLKTKEKYEEMYNRIDQIQHEIEVAREKVTSSNNQLKSLEEKIKKYNILAGTTEVSGQGVKITITDASINNSLISLLSPEEYIVHNTDVLEIVNELKNAGAEAISVNGQRISINTAISCDGNVVVINGEKVSSPFVIKAIGNQESLYGINRPGGYIQYMKDATQIDLKKSNNITIKKFDGALKFKYSTTVK